MKKSIFKQFLALLQYETLIEEAILNKYNELLNEAPVEEAPVQE